MRQNFWVICWILFDAGDEKARKIKQVSDFENLGRCAEKSKRLDLANTSSQWKSNNGKKHETWNIMKIVHENFLCVGVCVWCTRWMVKVGKNSNFFSLLCLAKQESRCEINKMIRDFLYLRTRKRKSEAWTKHGEFLKLWI